MHVGLDQFTRWLGKGEGTWVQNRNLTKRWWREKVKICLPPIANNCIPA